MNIVDRVYGDIEITDSTILDLINSKPFQRLKGINQAGAPNLIQPIRNVTRYEHSIGVWYLSKKFERPIEEQIACLLHDIPHTAFSHVIDVVVDDENHEFHDKFIEKIIMESEIPEILLKHNIDLKKILDKENFPLLDNELPDISFDRLDYFLRDTKAVGFAPHSVIQDFLDTLAIIGNTFYFKSEESAALFCILFREMSRLAWLDPVSHGAFYILADALKKSLELEIISEADFWLTDEAVLNKIRNSGNTEVLSILKKLDTNIKIIYSSKEESDYYGRNKPRCVDPYILVDNKLERITDSVISLKYANEEFIQNYKYLGVKILGNNQ